MAAINNLDAALYDHWPTFASAADASVGYPPFPHRDAAADGAVGHVSAARPAAPPTPPEVEDEKEARLSRAARSGRRAAASASERSNRLPPGETDPTQGGNGMTTDEYPVTIDTAADLIRRHLDWANDLIERGDGPWSHGLRAGLTTALAALTGRTYEAVAADDMARRRIQTDLQRACTAIQETALDAERTAS